MQFNKKWLYNKYVLCITGFLVWIIFFDSNSIITQHGFQQDLEKLEQERDYYRTEIVQNKELLNKLNTDSVAMEKYARESFHMKKPNEDVYVIVPESGTDNTEYKE